MGGERVESKLGLDATDVDRAGGRAINPQQIILNFHGIGLPADSNGAALEYWTSYEAFEAILDSVAKRPEFSITFDDGYSSDRMLALPALAARGMKAMFFVVANHLGKPGYLDREQLRDLCEAGMTVGNHGMYHRRWQGLNDSELSVELRVARTRLEECVGCKVRDAACPFGSYDRRVLLALRRCNYEHVYTSDGGATYRTSWLKPRNTILRSSWKEDVSKLINSSSNRAERLIKAVKLFYKRLR